MNASPSDHCSIVKIIWLLCGVLFLSSCTQSRQPVTDAFHSDTLSWPSSFGFGRLATQREIDSLDIDVRPDGQGLPPGSGDFKTGVLVYQQKCARCHGETGVEGPYNVLVTRESPESKKGRVEKTIGNYWPYATTVFDYINRAMPYDQPGSLTANEVYSLTAFLLQANGIIDSSEVLTAGNLWKIQMPAKNLFVNDDRTGGPEIR